MSIDSEILSALKHISLQVTSNDPYNNRGTWAPNTTYQLDDVVIENYGYFVCVTPHTSSDAIEYAYWDHLGIYSMAYTMDDQSQIGEIYMAQMEKLFSTTQQRALPLTRGGDLLFSVLDDSVSPPTPWPSGTTGVVEIENGSESLIFNATLVDGRLDFLIENERTDSVPATTSRNKVRWTLRIGLASNPTVEIPVFEGPIYRGNYG